MGARILIMDSGSYLQIGGAAKASYQLYTGLSGKKGCSIDLLGDFSQIDKGIETIDANTMLDREYDIIFMNSIRDVVIVTKYLRKYPDAKIVYTDRGNVIVNRVNAGLKALLPKMIARDMLLSRMGNWLDYYVAITAGQYREAQRYFGGNVKIRYIPIAPDKEFKKMKVSNKFDGAIYVGRLDERQKKIEFLIQGMKRTKELHADMADKELLKIVGAGPDELRYRELVTALSLEDNVVFEGAKYGLELVEEYNSAKFFVSTSEWESPGRSFLEAMACGLPILLNQRNNAIMSFNPEKRVVRSDYNGLVYDYDEIDGFVGKFHTLYADAKLRAKLSKGAVEYSKEFSLEKNIAQYRIIVDSLSK